jgi:hypothetical protein
VSGESGGTSCFNDDKVIGLRNLVTERDVPPPDLPLKGEEKEHREIIIKMRNSYILKLLL